MSWNYAELSKAAKVAGGPERLVEKIAEDSMRQGRKSMLPWVGIAIGVSSVVTVVVGKMVNHFRMKKETSQKALEEAKKELIQGIKDYDASYPDTVKDSQTDKDEESDPVIDS